MKTMVFLIFGWGGSVQSLVAVKFLLLRLPQPSPGKRCIVGEWLMSDRHRRAGQQLDPKRAGVRSSTGGLFCSLWHWKNERNMVIRW